MRPQSINRGNGYVINDHLQAKQTHAGHAPRHAIIATRAEIKILYTCFLPNTLAVRLLGYYFTFSFASSSCRIYKFISKHTCNYARCHELICVKCCRLVAKLARFLIMCYGLNVSLK